MQRPAALLIALVWLAGCHAPAPSFDLLAPYGAPRVPPPATGSYGSPQNYYQQSSQLSANGSGTGTTVRTSGELAEGERVAAARYEADAEVHTAAEPAEREPPIRIVEPDSAAVRTASRTEPARAGDPQQPSAPKQPAREEPGMFSPPPDLVEITELPQPPLAKAPQADSEPASDSSSSETKVTASGGWRSRYSPAD